MISIYFCYMEFYKKHQYKILAGLLIVGVLIGYFLQQSV